VGHSFKKGKALAILVVSAFMLSLFHFDLFALEEEITDKYPAAAPPPEKEYEEERKEFGPDYFKYFDIEASVDVQQGYDNNVDLDPDRHKDGFIQGIGTLEAKYKQFGPLRFKAGVDLFNTTYYKYNANNVLDVAPYIGFDFEMLPGIISRNRCTYDYFCYPNKKENTFSALELMTSLRHFITDDIFHELIYEYNHRWYADRKISLEDARKGDEDRGDDRHKIKHKLRLYFSKFVLKLANELHFSDSNDKYQDYYDYWAYRLRPGVMYFITDKLYTDASLLYKYTHYDNRRSTEDASKRVRNNTYVLNTALYYDLTKNVTFEISYTYTENTSNDPFEKYSGSIVSGGIYYSF
jgi:hypothetical protein